MGKRHTKPIRRATSRPDGPAGGERGFALSELPAVSQRKRGAFTLIELLVVIAIIVVLASVLLPAMNAALKKADETKARAEVKSLVNAWKAYFNEYGRWPVGASCHYTSCSRIVGREQNADETEQSLDWNCHGRQRHDEHHVSQRQPLRQWDEQESHLHDL